MDFLYHASTGIIISKVITGKVSPEATVFAVLPDLIGFVGHTYLMVKYASQHKTFWKKFHIEIQKTSFYNGLDKFSYRIAHSLFTWAGTTVLLYLLLPKLWLACSLSYLSHILIDIPTHDGAFAQRIFYPFSDWHIQGKYWTTNRNLIIFFWGLLILFVLLYW